MIFILALSFVLILDKITSVLLKTPTRMTKAILLVLDKLEYKIIFKMILPPSRTIQYRPRKYWQKVP